MWYFELHLLSTPKSHLVLPGLFFSNVHTTQAEIPLSFHNVSETLKFHYHLFDVLVLPHRSFFPQASLYITAQWTCWKSYTPQLLFDTIRCHCSLHFHVSEPLCKFCRYTYKLNYHNELTTTCILNYILRVHRYLLTITAAIRNIV